jgi:predicted HAD superfamily Cof-like phosphohydrolase
MHPDLESSIRDFQRHVGASPPTWPRVSPEEAKLIKVQAKELIAASAAFKNLYKQTGRNVFLRIELMLEELGEAIEGIGEGDQVKTLDGLVDCAYVVIGTATQFDLPFNKAFEEVHRSNMTKSSRGAVSHSGDKGKGAGFSPANIAGILAAHRAAQ